MSGRGIVGIHHVTAIAGDPQANVGFYVKVLGLRLVKRTVNFDDPGTYHLYYGDELGRPGTILTFFPWPNAPRGRRGAGQLTVTSFSVPAGSIEYWVDRLASHAVEIEEKGERFGAETLAFKDPDDLLVELVAGDRDERKPWEGGGVPAEHTIRGFHSVTLTESGYEATADLLTEGMGFRAVADERDRFRFAAGDGAPGAIVDVVCAPDAPPGLVAAGTVHHVAWRVAGDDEQREWRRRLVGRGLNVTPLLDRQYFRSIYYREPGGVLFEIATDPPGFTIDEPPERLGSELKLPPWLEPHRNRIEGVLPHLRVPASPRDA